MTIQILIKQIIPLLKKTILQEQKVIYEKKMIEDYEMLMNKKCLNKKYKKSVNSGKSDLVI